MVSCAKDWLATEVQIDNRKRTKGKRKCRKLQRTKKLMHRKYELDDTTNPTECPLINTHPFNPNSSKFRQRISNLVPVPLSHTKCIRTSHPRLRQGIPQSIAERMISHRHIKISPDRLSRCSRSDTSAEPWSTSERSS